MLFRSDEIAAARKQLSLLMVADELLEAVCGTACVLGVDSARASLMTVAAARANAALHGDAEVGADDVRVAAELVLAPRATRLPPLPESAADQEPAPPEPPPESHEENEPPPESESDPTTQHEPQALEDQILEATQAAIPAGLLSQLLAGGV